MLYDDRYHLHVGYYENGEDFEAIAYKRQSQETWDIFFDFEQYGLSKPILRTRLKDGAMWIFSIDKDELNSHYGAEKFKQWLSAQRLI
ncbi:DUF3986 family protein [Metabacillus sp. 84]|uniref:DUF3986 family protein n=1 Tax=Metabacillus sp. 84 TaxID=3404705 RepID=UPI003CEFD45B